MASGTKKMLQTQLLVDTITREDVSIGTSGTAAYGNYTFDSSHGDITKSGYTPIAIVGYRIATGTHSGTGATFVMCYGAILTSTTSASLYIRNTGSSTAKVNLSVDVLYRKD